MSRFINWIFGFGDDQINHVIKFKKGDDAQHKISFNELTPFNLLRISGVYKEIRGATWKYTQNPVISIYSVRKRESFVKSVQEIEKEATDYIKQADRDLEVLFGSAEKPMIYDSIRVRGDYSKVLMGVDLLKDPINNHRFYRVDKKTLNSI